MYLKDNILANLDKLPEALQIEIFHYSEYLVSRHTQENQEPKSTQRGGLGILKGKIWLSDNFDKPLEEMEEYRS